MNLAAFNSSALKPEGRDVLESAARAYAYHHDRSPVALELAGFADRSGSESHNRALAERRARTVRAVTHLDVSAAQVAHAAAVLSELLV